MRHVYLDHASVGDRPSNPDCDPCDPDDLLRANPVLGFPDEYASSNDEAVFCFFLPDSNFRSFHAHHTRVPDFLEDLLSFSQFVCVLRRQGFLANSQGFPSPLSSTRSIYGNAKRKEAGHRSEIRISERSLMLNN